MHNESTGFTARHGKMPFFQTVKKFELPLRVLLYGSSHSFMRIFFTTVTYFKISLEFADRVNDCRRKLSLAFPLSKVLRARFFSLINF